MKKLYCIIGSVLFFPLIQLAANPMLMGGRIQGISFNRIARSCNLIKTVSNGGIIYSSNRMKIVFNPPRREFFFNNIRIVPGFAPESRISRLRWYWKKESDIAVSRSDWNSTLKPLLFPADIPKHSVRTITLDAGHGGSDTGAIGRFSKEKNITLAITLRTAAILRACGYRVLLTRKTDRTLSLAERSNIQKKQRSDLFVSIHINAVKNRSIKGVETYALTPPDAPSTNGKSELRRHPANRMDANNFLLAYQIHKAMLSRTGAVDRGVKRARFAVLRDISAPGVLVEAGFISNSTEEQLLNSKAYIEKISRAIAEGILTYHRNISGPRR